MWEPTISPEGVCNALLLFNKLCHDQADKDTSLKANILLNNYQDSLMGFQQMSEDSQGQKAPVKRYGSCSNATSGYCSTF